MSSTSVTIPAQISPAVLNRQQINSHIIETKKQNYSYFLSGSNVDDVRDVFNDSSSQFNSLFVVSSGENDISNGSNNLNRFWSWSLLQCETDSQKSIDPILIDFVSILTKVLSIAILTKFLIAVTTFCGIFFTRDNHTFKLQVQLCEIYQ